MRPAFLVLVTSPPPTVPHRLPPQGSSYLERNREPALVVWPPTTYECGGCRKRFKTTGWLSRHYKMCEARKVLLKEGARKFREVHGAPETPRYLLSKLNSWTSGDGRTESSHTRPAGVSDPKRDHRVLERVGNPSTGLLFHTAPDPNQHGSIRPSILQPQVRHSEHRPEIPLRRPAAHKLQPRQGPHPALGTRFSRSLVWRVDVEMISYSLICKWTGMAGGTRFAHGFKRATVSLCLICLDTVKPTSR
jgi:hypothetical protein